MHGFRLAPFAACAAILATACTGVLAVPAARVCVLEPRSGWSKIIGVAGFVITITTKSRLS